jgi:hypothetical protein
MTLDNGVIRAMDASLPVARALAIAGDRIVGGIGTHETALAPPDRVDLRGRCALPGSASTRIRLLVSPAHEVSQAHSRPRGGVGARLRARRGERLTRSGEASLVEQRRATGRSQPIRGTQWNGFLGLSASDTARSRDLW